MAWNCLSGGLLSLISVAMINIGFPEMTNLPEWIFWTAWAFGVVYGTVCAVAWWRITGER